MYENILFNWTVKKNHTLSFSAVFTYFNLGSFEWALLKKTFLSELFQITSLKLHTLPDCFTISSKLVTVFKRTDLIRLIDLSSKPELISLKHKYFVARLCIGKNSYDSFKVPKSKYDLFLKMQPFFSSLPSTYYYYFFFRYVEYNILARNFVSFNNYRLIHNYLLYL